MRKKFVWLLVSSLMVLSLVLASCTTAEQEEEEEGPITGENWWDEYGEPEYGGTIIFAPNRYREGFDPYHSPSATYMWFLETLVIADWTLDRVEFPFKTNYVPQEYAIGCLAESWEISDPQTMVVHIREGIHWQDK